MSEKYTQPYDGTALGGQDPESHRKDARRNSRWSLGAGSSRSQRRGSINDAVFGEITEDGPNYRDVGWLGTVVLMMKTQVGLGVLSIPAVFNALGLIPGVICLLVIGAITTWSNYMIGVFKRNHPEVYSIDDVGQMIFGRAGREILAFVFCLFWIAAAGSGMLGISISLNTLSEHGACTAIFVAVAFIIGFGFASIRTLGKVAWIAWIGLFGIMSAIFALTVAVGLEGRPASAPKEGHWESDFKLFGSPTFAKAASSLSSLVFAYAGTPAFFSIASEMRDVKNYTKSLLVCQGAVTAIYVSIGVVVYYYCGSYVASPALGSAGVLMQKVCYGLALPGLIASTMLLLHFPAKFIFVRLMRGSAHLVSNSWQHWVSWLGCTFVTSLISYIIASAVPVFDGLVALVGALLGTLLCFQPMGFMWLYDNWRRGKNGRGPRWMFGVCFSIFVIISGTFLMIAGTYGSVVDIMDSYKATGGSAAWTCIDNSNT
ncbi:putative amino acid transporter, partial [Byssothecium circinans]